METSDFEKIEKIRRDRKEAHDFLADRSKAYGAFVHLAREAFAEGTLDRKTKELIRLRRKTFVVFDLYFSAAQSIRNFALLLISIIFNMSFFSIFALKLPT